jgi:hypothetical protein
LASQKRGTADAFSTIKQGVNIMKKLNLILVAMSATLVLSNPSIAANEMKDSKDPKRDASARDIKKVEEKIAGEQKAASSRASATEVKDFLKKASEHIVKAGGKEFTAAKLAIVVKQFKDSKSEVDALNRLVKAISKGEISGAKVSQETAAGIVCHFLELKTFDTSGNAMPISPSALEKILTTWDVTATTNLSSAFSEATKRVAGGDSLEAALKEALKLVGIDNYDEFITKCKQV